jgi:hypothetical protein
VQGREIKDDRLQAIGHRTERELSVMYRVTALSGSAVARWHGIGAPACARLDACDSTGTVRIAPRVTRGERLEVDVRTRCPGPELGNHAVAVAEVPIGSLRQSRLTLRFNQREAFGDRGYDVRVDPVMSLTLTRTAIVRRVY